MKEENLKMIAFGTKGNDGIDEGIHLRWSFNEKLGFPPCFKLYRRKSNLNNKVEFPFDTDNIPLTIDIPFTFQPSSNKKFKFRLDSVIHKGRELNSLKRKFVTLEDGIQVRCIRVNGEVSIHFSRAVSRIELRFILEDISDFEIKIQSEQGSYYPYKISGETTGMQNLSFDAARATGIILRGTGIQLYWLAAWICKDGKGWERINNLCGCGLPVNQEGTNYTDEVYPANMGRDLATALCRMGFNNVPDSPITTAEFLELKAMLLTMDKEGQKIPVGWTLFPNTEEDAVADDGVSADQALEFSKYDFLLTQSLHVFFAKILDLYFVDSEAKNNTFYDYKITAQWPEWNLRRLGYEITFEKYEVNESFIKINQLDDNVVLLAETEPQIVESSYTEFKTKKGIEIGSENNPTLIDFRQSVTEVQLVLINSDFSPGERITLEAYKYLNSAYVDKVELMVDRGIVRLRAKQIDYIKIHGAHVIISRIHYDFEPYPEGLQQYIVCGVFKHTHLPLQRPADLNASFLPGGPQNDKTGNITEKPYMAGLRWLVNENARLDLISIAPVLYHIEKKPQNGTVELLTEDAPVFVSPSVIEESERDIPVGWPEERQYYLDTISLSVQNSYRVSALDLFGRQSEFTDPETYEVKLPKPAHPVDVVAKFLDYNTYNPLDQSFSDSTINAEDKAWLEANGKKAIVVRWKWPANLQLQSPNVDSFKVHYQPGWLNTYTGVITSEPLEELLTKTSLNFTQDELDKYAILDVSPNDIPVYKFEVTFDLQLPPEIDPLPDDALRLCWLTQGNHSFLIIKNNGGNQANVWVLKLNDLPVKDKGFGIAITPGKVFFINYKNPVKWTNTSISHDEPKNGSIEEYTVYIENPDFPNPAISASDRNKVRYAQIGVNSCIGTVEGGVSPPSTIMAVYRDAPAALTAFAPLPGTEIQALKATPANIHGKSFFALRWSKTNLGLKHHVFRALDDTLYKIDNANRPIRNDAVYNDFETDFAQDVAVLKNIPYETDPVLVSSHYAGLTPGQLQLLACLPDNQNAFTKISIDGIEENDPLYQDRITEIPDPVNGPVYTINPDTLLYLDKTLSGKSTNRYFYALRTVDTNGMQSPLSAATPPVEIPKTTPPPVPVITSVSGGENKVTVKWAKNPGADIAGYLVYRTQDLIKARDYRKMELIKANDTDSFSVAVNGSLPTKEFEFTDKSAIARQAYYYGVVAVGLSDDGKWLPSRVSQAVVGQAYDVTPPEAPIFILLQRIENEDGMHILINWQSNESMECKLKRRVTDMVLYEVISDLIIGNYNPISNYWEYEFIDTNILSDTTYVYQIFSTDLAGNVAMSLVSTTI